MNDSDYYFWVRMDPKQIKTGGPERNKLESPVCTVLISRHNKFYKKAISKDQTSFFPLNSLYFSTWSLNYQEDQFST